VHAAADEPAFVGYDPVDDVASFTPEDRARELLEEHVELRDLAAELASGGVDVRPRLVMGPTVEVLSEEADRLGVGWIVVASHGHGGLRNLLLGSVSEGLVRRADRPVVVVPAHDDA
jgi:nucleotide-binding universal stress UspA family protein